MNRRQFLSLSLAAPALAQRGEPQIEPVESMVPVDAPLLAINHLGFLPQSRKIALLRYAGEDAPPQFVLRDIAGGGFRQTRPLKQVATDIVQCWTGDFSDVTRPGMYQVSVGEELSVPFFIRQDVWRRTLPKAVGYYRQQRCGVEVPNVHPVCHLDDARRRDTGEHIDTTGGWHDAGDLRKWMSATLLNGIALLRLARNLGEKWDAAGSGLRALHEEVRWGNRYFLKMQDRDGLVWNDTAGGVNGDNSDNHWTDNQPGTKDDRYINPSKPGLVQAMFVTLQAMSARDLGDRACLQAALRCWKAWKPAGDTRTLSWAALAALELHRATGEDAYAAAATLLGGLLLGLQQTAYAGSQKEIRGYWRASETDAGPYANAVDSALPPLALLELASEFPSHRDARRWRDAVTMHLDNYLAPLAAHSPYDTIPYGVFDGAPTPETYRPLAGALTYRYFMPVRKQRWWIGNTSHLLCYATLLAAAGRRDLAFRQLEWVMGANPFAACLMTGEGMRNPYPHSRFVGLIPGGIMNGIAGNMKDEPVLDTYNGFDWRTTEYWSPHNAWYIWAVSTLERG
ncbi:MAG: glycoside hydrolase family 9 protein [Bryobacteraceae bacterium]